MPTSRPWSAPQPPSRWATSSSRSARRCCAAPSCARPGPARRAGPCRAARKQGTKPAVCGVYLPGLPATRAMRRDTMSVRSVEIIDLLPSLRRYALALIGDQVRADAAVELCLERLLADQGALASAALRVAAFRLFDPYYAQAVSPVCASAAACATDGLPAALQRLPPQQRKALLLVTIAGVSH